MVREPFSVPDRLGKFLFIIRDRKIIASSSFYPSVGVTIPNKMNPVVDKPQGNVRLIFRCLLQTQRTDRRRINTGKDIYRLMRTACFHGVEDRRQARGQGRIGGRAAQFSSDSAVNLFDFEVPKTILFGIDVVRVDAIGCALLDTVRNTSEKR